MLTTAAKGHTRLVRAMARTGAADYRSLNYRAKLMAELEKERARMARDLHAGAGQPLAGIKLNAELLRQWADTMPESAREALSRLNILAEAALDQVRAVSHRLYPPAWQALGISEALQHLARTSGVEQKFEEVRLEIVAPAEDPPWPSRVALYRCAQEGISNAIRHSCGTAFRLTLQETGSFLELCVSDNGVGLPTTLDAEGIGLRAISEQATSAGGHCKFSTTPGGGTTIVVAVPLTD